MKEKIHSILIETERLVLRIMQPEDVTGDYADWLNDPAINRYLAGAGNTQTVDSCKTYVASFLERDNGALIGIFDQNGLHLGNLSISTVFWERKIADIGICLGRKEYQGRGLASEALAALIEFCFSELGIHRLHAGIHVGNEPSLNLFKRCGFQVEGVLRDHDTVAGEFTDCYTIGMLESDPRP